MVDRATPDLELFFDSLIEAYTGDPRFLERGWLQDAIRDRLTAGHERPFLLITAEPGTGKSAFLAWLAKRNANWPRYFIRRNEVSPLGPPGARSFLFRIGLQMAAVFPRAFNAGTRRITVEQRLRCVTSDASVIGAEIQRLIASPFVTATIGITQEVEAAAGKVAGLKIGEYVAEPRLSPVSDLQYLALIDPATAVAADSPDQLLVVLIDAIDELRYQPQEDSLLHWLENCPALPANVRLVITSRPDDDLLRTFRDRQSDRIQEFPLDFQASGQREKILSDLQTYARHLATPPAIAAKIAAAGMTEDKFVEAAVERAEGNLGYLGAVGRAVEQFILQKDDPALAKVVRLTDLPPGLRQLYAYFLHLVKRRAVERSVGIVDSAKGTVARASAWPEVHSPVLGSPQCRVRIAAGRADPAPSAHPGK